MYYTHTCGEHVESAAAAVVHLAVCRKADRLPFRGNHAVLVLPRGVIDPLADRPVR